VICSQHGCNAGTTKPDAWKTWSSEPKN